MARVTARKSRGFQDNTRTLRAKIGCQRGVIQKWIDRGILEPDKDYIKTKRTVNGKQRTQIRYNLESVMQKPVVKKYIEKRQARDDRHLFDKCYGRRKKQMMHIYEKVFGGKDDARNFCRDKDKRLQIGISEGKPLPESDVVESLKEAATIFFNESKAAPESIVKRFSKLIKELPRVLSPFLNERVIDREKLMRLNNNLLIGYPEIGDFLGVRTKKVLENYRKKHHCPIYLNNNRAFALREELKEWAENGNKRIAPHKAHRPGRDLQEALVEDLCFIEEDLTVNSQLIEAIDASIFRELPMIKDLRNDLVATSRNHLRRRSELVQLLLDVNENFSMESTLKCVGKLPHSCSELYWYFWKRQAAADLSE